MQATAIVPVKRFSAAKQRLADALPVATRATLAEAMLTDVLAALGRARSIESTVVVSGEPVVARIAASRGATVLDDPVDAGHSEAALIGVDTALAAGAERVALLPGDCPLLDPGELDRAVTRHARGSVGVIADRHGTGTNGLLLDPPDAIEPAFGPGSCARHLARAAAAGVAAEVVPLPSMDLDLDTGEDLELLRGLTAAGALSGSATGAALAALDLGAREAS